MRSPPGPAPAAGPLSWQSQTRRGQLRLAGLLHPFAWGAQAPVLSNEGLAEALAEPLGIQTIAPRGPGGASSHQLSLNRIGPHRLAAWVGTAIELQAGSEAPITLYLLRGGWLEWQAAEGMKPLAPGWLLLSGGGSYRLRSGICAVVAIGLNRGRLALQLSQLSGEPLDERATANLLRRPLLLGPSGAPCGALVQALGCLLDLYERLELQDPRLVARLELDQLLERLVATLLLTAAFGRQGLALSGAEAATARQDEAFEALLARIRSRLADPIDLATLATWAGCSARTLQVLFRQRLSCTPIQWLRRERLQLAQRLLLQAQPGESVASIARRCGYTAASHFSEDFRRQFGRTPSQVLRGAKAAQSPP